MLQHKIKPLIKYNINYLNYYFDDIISNMRQVLIYKGDNGMWVAECPSLPGCLSQGETREEAIENIREAIKAYIDVLEEDGLPIPEERYESIIVVI